MTRDLLLRLLLVWTGFVIVLAVHSGGDAVWLAALGQAVSQHLTHSQALHQRVQDSKRLLGVLCLAEEPLQHTLNRHMALVRV